MEHSQLLWAHPPTEEVGFQPSTLAKLAALRISEEELTTLCEEAVDRNVPLRHLLELLYLHHEEEDGNVYDVKVDISHLAVHYGGCNGRFVVLSGREKGEKGEKREGQEGEKARREEKG